MFKRILCAVDFSQASLAAFRQAVELARLHQASLELLHVVEAQAVASHLLPEEDLLQITLKIEAKAREALEKLQNSFQEELTRLPLKIHISTGHAFVEINQEARRWKADLVVIGSRGADSLEEIVLGRTSSRLLGSLPCSLLVVRP